MAFQFVTGRWAIPAINESGDFSYTTVLTYDASASGITAIGELGTGNNSITFLSGGLLRIRVGSTSIPAFSGFVHGDILDITVTRVAGSVSATINGGAPSSVSTASVLNITNFGRGFDAASQYTGIIYSFTFSGDNALSRNYNFDAAPGTTVLTDLSSSQDGTPVGFTTDDFIGSGGGSVSRNRGLARGIGRGIGRGF